MELLTIRVMRLMSSCTNGTGKTDILALVGDADLAAQMCSWLNDTAHGDEDGSYTYHHYWCEEDDSIARPAAPGRE